MIIDLHNSGMSLGAISKQRQLPSSSVYTIVCKFLGDVATLPSRFAGKRPKLSPWAERKLVRMVRNNQGTIKEAVGTLSTAKRVLPCHGLRGCHPTKKPLLQNQHFQAQLQFAPDHMDEEKSLLEESFVVRLSLAPSAGRLKLKTLLGVPEGQWPQTQVWASSEMDKAG